MYIKAAAIALVDHIPGAATAADELIVGDINKAAIVAFVAAEENSKSFVDCCFLSFTVAST